MSCSWLIVRFWALTTVRLFFFHLVDWLVARQPLSSQQRIVTVLIGTLTGFKVLQPNCLSKLKYLLQIEVDRNV